MKVTRYILVFRLMRTIKVWNYWYVNDVRNILILDNYNI